MYNNNGMYTNYEVESSKETFTESESSKKMTNMTAGMGNGIAYQGSSCMMNSTMYNTPLQGMVCQPIYECPQERIIHREIMHEVPHVCPVNTRIVNHHIYKHTFSPCYTCCEENEVCNITEPCNPCCF